MSWMKMCTYMYMYLLQDVRLVCILWVGLSFDD